MSNQSILATHTLLQRAVSQSMVTRSARSHSTQIISQGRQRLLPIVEETSTTTMRAFSVNGYNHDGPRGAHITPHNPTRDHHDHKNDDNHDIQPSSTTTSPRPTTRMPHDNQKGRPSNNKAAESITKRWASTATAPPFDIQDESDLEEMKKMEDSQEFTDMMKARSSTSSSSDDDTRKSNQEEEPMTNTGYKTTNGPNPVVDIRDTNNNSSFSSMKETTQESVGNAKDFMADAAQEAQVKAGQAQEHAAHAGEYMVEKAKDAQVLAKDAKEYLQDKSEEAQVQATQAKEYLGEKTEQAKVQAEETREYLSEKSEEAQIKAQELQEQAKVHAEQAKTQAQETQAYLGDLASRTQETLKPYLESAKETLQDVKETFTETSDDSSSKAAATMNKPVDAVKDSQASSLQNNIAQREFENGENGKDRTEIEYHNRQNQKTA